MLPFVFCLGSPIHKGTAFESSCRGQRPQDQIGGPRSFTHVCAKMFALSLQVGTITTGGAVSSSYSRPYRNLLFARSLDVSQMACQTPLEARASARVTLRTQLSLTRWVRKFRGYCRRGHVFPAPPDHEHKPEVAQENGNSKLIDRIRMSALAKVVLVLATSAMLLTRQTAVTDARGAVAWSLSS